MTVLFIDIGTTNIKYLLMEGQQEIFRGSDSVNMMFKDGFHVQSPQMILSDIIRQIHHMTALYGQIEIISLSVPMHTLIYQDQLLIWSDNRAYEWVESFKLTSNSERFYHMTGTPIHPMSPFAKIGYLKQQGLIKNEDVIIGLKEYILKYFTGQYYLDYSTASTTGLFDLHQLTWSQEICDTLDISINKLAELVDTHEKIHILPEVINELNLATNAKFHIGACDGCLASYATLQKYGDNHVMTMGTSGAVRSIVDTPYFTKDGSSFCYYLTNNHWVIGGPTNNGGNVIQWWSQIIYNDSNEIYSHLDEIYKHSCIHENHISMQPFLNGERAPYWDILLTGSFSNLKQTHTRNDLSFAVIRGVLENLHNIAISIGVEGPIRVNGGVFRNSTMRKILSDIRQDDVFLAEKCEPVDGLRYLMENE